MGDSISNQDAIVPKGNSGVVQLSDGGGDLKGVSTVFVTDDGHLNATLFVGDGGGLSNVSGGGGGVGTLQEVTDLGNTTSNTIQFTNSITSLTASGNVEVSGNVTASVFYGNAEGLSNIVNSSIAEGVYGNAQAVSQITIDSNHRITDISNVPIQLTLQEVSDVGNTTSNTIQFTNPLTSLKTTGNVAIGDGASETLSRLYVKGDIPAVVGIESTAVLSGIAFRSSGTGTEAGTPAIGCMANDFVIYSGNPASEALRVYDGGNVEATNLFLGNANSLSNIVNSDITSGVYGNATAVSQITISDDHRITSISNVPIQLTLQEITDVGNTTSNVVQFTATPDSLVATGNAVAYNTKVGTVSDTEISALNDFFPTFVQGGIPGDDPRVRRHYVDSTFKWRKDTELLTVSNLLVSQDATVTGNLIVNGTTTTLNTENLIVEDPIIQLANGSAIQTADAGIVFTRPTTSNIAIGWRGDEDEFMVAFSTSSASGTTLAPIDNNEMKLKVYGNVEVTNLFLGNANNLSNIVNSDITPGIYGNAQAVSQITIDSEHRITDISNVPIQLTLQEVSDVGNTTSNTIQFTNPLTSLKTTGNVAIGDGASETLSRLYIKGDIPAVVGIESTSVLSGIAFRSSGTGTEAGTPAIGCMANDFVIYSGNPASEALRVYDGGNVEATNLFLGNANSLSNIVNSDITPGIYGNATAVSQITISDDHRITAISNVLIDLYNLNNVSVDTTTLDNNQILRYDGSNFINEYNNVTAIPIKAGESLSKGNVVYISDNSGDTPIVNKADASDPSKMPAIGVIIEGNLSLNDDGHVITFGIFGDTFNGLVGETMYVSNITPGLLSNVKPLGPTDGIQNVGIVENTDSKILITGVGRTNDIPNAVEESNVSNVNYFYVETNDSRFEKIGLSDFRSNLQQVTDTGNVTSNTVQFTNSVTSLTASGNVEVTGTANVGEITVNTSIGTTSLTTGNVFFDADNKSYRVSNISTSGVFSGLDIANAPEGCQIMFELEASGGTLDVANTFVVAGSNLTSVKTNYSTNVSLSSGSFGVMTVFVRNSNAFVACTEFS